MLLGRSSAAGGLCDNFMLVQTIVSDMYSSQHTQTHIVSVQVLKRAPTLKKLDGVPVDVDELEAAKGG